MTKFILCLGGSFQQKYTFMAQAMKSWHLWLGKGFGMYRENKKEHEQGK